MKLLKLSLVFLVALFWGACNNDDESSCDQNGWLGTYTGTTDCLSGDEEVTVTITASGSEDLLMRYETATGGVDIGPFVIDGCKATRSSMDPSSLDSFVGELELDGGNLSYTQTRTVAGTASSCTFDANK
ncbi:MAG: hypothetical protein AAGG75_08720 [Bacteroidota bacterium]